jgi:hypothetical protein
LPAFTFVLILLGFALTLSSRALGDENRTHIEDAHHQLALALNMGGPTPADTDRTAELKAAEADLKEMTLTLKRYSRARNMAVTHIENALDLIAHGDPDHQAEQEIRDADAVVRDIEG